MRKIILRGVVPIEDLVRAVGAEEEKRNLATHTFFVDDPPDTLSSMQRQICSTCGRSILTSPNHRYGSALRFPCVSAEQG